jgi:HPt (histidine-containing phosphotransfer) domain-containing protein
MDDPDKEVRLLEKLATIREGFLHRTQSELPLLVELLGRVQSGDSTGLAPLKHLVHRLHGSAAIFEFAALSSSAGQIEDLLEGFANAPTVAIDALVLDRLAECGRQLTLRIGSATISGTNHPTGNSTTRQ